MLIEQIFEKLKKKFVDRFGIEYKINRIDIDKEIIEITNSKGQKFQEKFNLFMISFRFKEYFFLEDQENTRRKK